jgi:hypothetical protein
VKSWQRYAWLDEASEDILMAGCLAVATATTEAAVRRRFAVDESSRRVASFEDAWGMSESGFGNDVVQVGVVGVAVVAVEPNGWHGVDEGVAAELSRAGRYAALFWNVNSVMRFVYAEDGVVRRSFDPLLYDGGNALEEERDLPFPSDSQKEGFTPHRASLALLERLTGVAITRSWLLDELRPTFRRVAADT